MDLTEYKYRYGLLFVLCLKFMYLGINGKLYMAVVMYPHLTCNMFKTDTPKATFFRNQTHALYDELMNYELYITYFISNKN